MTNTSYCGSCGVACGAGVDCAGGACVGTVIGVEVGNNTVCALRDNGRAICWGNFSIVSTDMPGGVQVPSEFGLVDAMGARITDATNLWIEGDPNRVCVTRGGSAQLECATSGASNGGSGHGVISGTTIDLSPIVFSSVEDISFGRFFGCAVAGGGVSCFGLNTGGQLGDGSTTSSPTPVGVLGLGSGATAVSSANTHSCAIVSGEVYCWGGGGGYELGDGSGLASTSPVRAQFADPLGDPSSMSPWDRAAHVSSARAERSGAGATSRAP